MLLLPPTSPVYPRYSAEFFYSCDLTGQNVWITESHDAQRCLTSPSAVECVKGALFYKFCFHCLLLISFQISLLTSAVNHLKANVKSAADLISLPATVEGLQKVSAVYGH